MDPLDATIIEEAKRASVLLLSICVVIVDGKKPMRYLDVCFIKMRLIRDTGALGLRSWPVSRIPSQTVNHRNRGVGLVEISVVESAQVTEVSVPTSPGTESTKKRSCTKHNSPRFSSRRGLCNYKICKPQSILCGENSKQRLQTKLISLNKCGNEISHGQVTFSAIEMRNMCSSVNPSSLPTVVARALRTADVVTHHDMAARTSVTTTRMFDRVTNLPSNNNESGFASQKVMLQGAQQHLHTEQHLHTAAAVRACHTTDGSTVPVSTVFDRFRELKMPRLQSNYVTHTGAERAISCQLPLPTANHAYLCLDLINCTIIPEIVTFSNNNKEKRRTSHLNAGHSRSHARFTCEPVLMYMILKRLSCVSMGPIDVLVCNQGVFVSHKLQKQEINEVKDMIDVNLVGTFNVVKAALPGMKNRSDRKPVSIVFMSSQAGQASKLGGIE
ncbi:3-dehydrosphinganine reductase TSC10A-like protein [Tanacetum coccineum]